MLSTYQPADGSMFEPGTPIVMLIQDDWEVFSERLIERDGADALLESIMHTGWDDDDGTWPLGANDPYVGRDRVWSHTTLAEIWEQFAEEVRASPDHILEFRGADFDAFLIHEELTGRRTSREPAGRVFYRARPGFRPGTEKSPEPYSGVDIGAPPPHKVLPGRANAEGKLVLYCADEERTAVAEMRPGRGEYISVAELKAVRELSILDLASEPEWPNPFTDHFPSHEIEFASLLSGFAEELGKPLRRRDEPRDYLPSQKLTELIEKTGVDGIRYPSAMAPGGTNVVLFNRSVVEVGASRLVEIAEARIEYQALDDY
jgi:RES domain